MNQPQKDHSTTSYTGLTDAPPSRTGYGQEPPTGPPAGSLAAHLERSDRGEEPRLSPERYANQLAGLARELGGLHERGILHGDVRPQSISFAAGTEELSLAAPALADAGAPLPVGDPYIAPEQHLGEQGASIDQYALGVVSREVFTARAAPPPTAPLLDVLRQATAPGPDDRFSDVGALGEALTSAVNREAPYGWADRLAARSARTRAALAPAGLFAGLILAVALDDARDPLTGPLFIAVLAPVTAVAAAVLVAGLVWIAGAIRRPRWRSLRFVRPPWVPLLAVVSILTLVGLGGGSVMEEAFQVIVGVYGLRMLLAPPPESSGRWLIAVLRRWDMRRVLPPVRRRLVTFGFPTAILAVLLAPVIVGTLWSEEFEFPTSPAREFSPLVAVADFRGAIGAGDYGFACRKLLTAEAAAPRRDCPDVVHWADVVQDNDPLTESGARILGMRGVIERYKVQELPPPGNGRFWRILTADGKREAGAMYTVGTSGERITVLLTRKPFPPPGSKLRSLWLYETVWQPDHWRISEFSACEVGVPGSGRRDAKCLAKDDLPGDRARALLARVEANSERR
ncbi:MAG TPA: hypothetical protein VMS60_00195 [Solirubrobacterales bacterium]|nr:hypothetical protein [Solirubrobacterales bacterium]